MSASDRNPLIKERHCSKSRNSLALKDEEAAATTTLDLGERSFNICAEAQESE